MSNPLLGQLIQVGFSFAPRGWSFCDGQLLPISQYQALFSLLGTTYGGDGRTTFALPDLRGRVAVSPGRGGGLSNYNWGQKGGQEEVTLTAAQIPSHTHKIGANSGEGDSTTPTGRVLAQDPEDVFADDANANLKDPTSVGGSREHTNVAPFLGINHCIAMQGQFPSRS